MAVRPGLKLIFDLVYLRMGANAVALRATRQATRAERRKENLAMVMYIPDTSMYGRVAVGGW